MIKDAGGSAFPAANPLDTRIAPAEITLQPRLYRVVYQMLILFQPYRQVLDQDGLQLFLKEPISLQMQC